MRARRLVPCVLLLLGIGIGAAVGGGADAGVAGTSSGEILRLRSAPMAFEAEGDLTIDIEVPTTFPTSLEMSVRPIDENTTDIELALGRATGAPLDSVTLIGDAITVVDGALRLTVPTESISDFADRLQFPRAGLYAVRLETNTGATVTVPVMRRVRNDEQQPVPVTVVLSLDSTISVQPDGTRRIDDGTRQRLERLSEFLGRSLSPVSVAIRPELLVTLAQIDDDGRRLVAELAEDFGRQRLLSGPYLHVDPSVAANAGLVPDFTTQLRRGEDALAATLQRLPDRRLWVATDPLSPAGAALVRNLGAVVVLQTAGAIQDLPGTASAGIAAQPVLIPTDIDSRLAAPSKDPALTAHYIAFDLFLSKANDPRPAVVLFPNLETAVPDTLDALMRLLAAGDLLRGVDVEQVGIGTTGGISPGDDTVADIGSVRTQRASLRRVIEATSAIIPVDDPRRDSWPVRADVLLDTRLTDEQRTAYYDGVRSEMIEVQNNVALQVPKAVNLGDRKTNIPITIQNNNDFPVTVAVRLSSAKLRFPPVSDVITVEEGATQFVDIPVSARSNGRFPVTAQLLAPGTTLVVGRSAVMNVRVGRLTGLGIVVTFGLGLVLLTWWVQHLRRRWRRVETAEIERRRLAGMPVDDLDDVVTIETAPTVEQPMSWRNRESGDPDSSRTSHDIP